MDMIYHMPFRDWLKIDQNGAPTPETEESTDTGGGSAST